TDVVMTIDGSGISGGSTNLGSSKTGTNVTVTSSTGTNTTFSVSDNDNSSTNEIQTVSSYSNPTATAAIARLSGATGSGGLRFEGSGGIDVDATSNGTDVVMTIDGSGISGGATNLGSSKSGVNVTVTSSTGTNTTFSVADNDNSASNELQSIS